MCRQRQEFHRFKPSSFAKAYLFDPTIKVPLYSLKILSQTLAPQPSHQRFPKMQPNEDQSLQRPRPPLSLRKAFYFLLNPTILLTLHTATLFVLDNLVYHHQLAHPAEMEPTSKSTAFRKVIKLAQWETRWCFLAVHVYLELIRLNVGKPWLSNGEVPTWFAAIWRECDVRSRLREGYNVAGLIVIQWIYTLLVSWPEQHKLSLAGDATNSTSGLSSNGTFSA